MESVTLDRLAGEWRIHQLERGHRFSTDDLLTAWRAAMVMPDANALLDLGAGIGSVGLMALWRLESLRPSPLRRLVMVEAQQVSHQLAKKTVEFNGLTERVEARWGDLREPALVPEEGAFSLITGSPPYIPLGKGVVSPHPQKAACRMELRGTIADYAQTAARALAPDGRFVCCFAGQDPRAEEAIFSAGLQLHWRTDVYFREVLPPTICLLVAGHSVIHPQRDRLVIRDRSGAWTSDYLRIRQEMGTTLLPKG